MTTTPLPPLPETRVIGYYTSVQMREYAHQARADLEAENQRLRAALEVIVNRFGSIRNELIFSKRLAIDKARAAMEKQP